MPSLMKMLAALEDVDMLLERQIDPESLIGDVRDKVDGIKAVLDKLQNYWDLLDEQITEMESRRGQVFSNIEALKGYVKASMVGASLQSVPGHTWKVDLQDSPASVSLSKEEPDKFDDLAHPQYVITKKTYRWDKKLILEHLKAGKELPFATLCRGNHIRFRLYNPAKQVRKSLEVKALDQ